MSNDCQDGGTSHWHSLVTGELPLLTFAEDGMLVQTLILASCADQDLEPRNVEDWGSICCGPSSFWNLLQLRNVTKAL